MALVVLKGIGRWQGELILEIAGVHVGEPALGFTSTMLTHEHNAPFALLRSKIVGCAQGHSCLPSARWPIHHYGAIADSLFERNLQSAVFNCGESQIKSLVSFRS